MRVKRENLKIDSLDGTKLNAAETALLANEPAKTPGMVEKLPGKEAR